MKKEEFIKTLRKRLNILKDSEVEDIISEYKGYIEEKVNLGKTEEEAVKELGNIEEIVEDLLAAYKVKSPREEENGFTRFINKIMSYLDLFIEELNKRSAKDILKFIIEICIIIMLISLFKIPFSLLKDLGWNIFSGMPLAITKIFYGIWSFIIDLSYFIISIIMFIKILEKRYFEEISEKIVTSNEENNNQEKAKNNSRKKPKEIKKEEVIIERANKGKNNFLSIITNICIMFLKFIVMICLIGIIFYLVGMSFAFGIMVYLIINGVKYFGIALLFIALIQVGALFLELGINFIFNKKQKVLRIFIEIISIVTLTGIGLTFGAIEIANTEIIYDNYYQDTNVITKEIGMTKNIEIYNYDNIVIDETIGNNIIIEYKYPNIYENMDINIETEKCGTECYYLGTNIKTLKWTKSILEDIIANLKEKKIYTYEFYIEKTINISQANYEILINNKENSENKEPFYAFVRTYNILNKSNSNDSEYIYLTLRQYQDEEVETVRISKALGEKVIIGKNYEFTFEYHGYDTDMDELDEIFEKCDLIQIKLTDKVGLDQIQEPID